MSDNLAEDLPDFVSHFLKNLTMLLRRNLRLFNWDWIVGFMKKNISVVIDRRYEKHGIS